MLKIKCHSKNIDNIIVDVLMSTPKIKILTVMKILKNLIFFKN